MANPSIWFSANDMSCTLNKVQSSTMASTAYLEGSTGVTVKVYNALSTASTAVVSTNVPASTSAATGKYTVAVQTTDHSMAVNTQGLAIFSLSHSGLTAEWRVDFWVRTRGES